MKLIEILKSISYFGWLTIILFVGLSIGAYWQASTDVTTMNRMLNESALNGGVLFDGIHYYTIKDYTEIDMNQDYINYLYGNNSNR